MPGAHSVSGMRDWVRLGRRPGVDQGDGEIQSRCYTAGARVVLREASPTRAEKTRMREQEGGLVKMLGAGLVNEAICWQLVAERMGM